MKWLLGLAIIGLLLSTQGCAQPPEIVSGGEVWTTIFNDECDSIDTNLWNVQNNSTWGTPPREQTYMAANVTAVNGICLLEARKESTVTSGMMTTRKLQGPVTFRFKYGYVETRAKFPTGDPFWPSIWLVGPGDGSTPEWPEYGEIDIVEGYGINGKLESNFHWLEKGVHKNIGSANHPLDGGLTAWHTYGLNWTPDRLEWVYDGRIVRTFVPTTADQKKALTYDHVIIWNLQIGGMSWTGYKPPADPYLPGVLEIDYTRVWQKT